MKYLIIVSILITSVAYSRESKDLSTMATIDGVIKFIKCPDWDWSLIPPECKNPYMISFNCLPKCGKYPSDKPDIGAFEYFPGITNEKPWGDWDGIPRKYDPGQEPPSLLPPLNVRN